MKNILNRILIPFLVAIVFMTSLSETFAVEIATSNRLLKVYSIKEKDEVLVEDNKIINFYQENYDELEKLIEEKKLEDEKIAKEQRINFKTQIVNYAKEFIGNPYVMGGNSLTSGTDCSGFVMLVYASYDISLPRTTVGQAMSGTEVLLENIEIGDIISYGYNGYPSHSAIYIGNGMIIHASTPTLGIVISSMYIMPIITIRRVA